MLKKIAIASALALGACGVLAETITFDDIDRSVMHNDNVPNGYAGFNWSGIYLTNGTDLPFSPGNETDVYSAPYAGFIHLFGGSGSFSAVDGKAFYLNSMYLDLHSVNDTQRDPVCANPAAYCPAPNFYVTVSGSDGSNHYSDTFLLGMTSHVMDFSDWLKPVTQVNISIGLDFYYGGYSAYALLDNVSVTPTPLPAAGLLLGGGLMGMLGIGRKRRTAG